LIKKLSEAYIIGVISNSPKEWAEKMLEGSGLEDYIKVKSLSGFYHVRKPDIKIFDMALNEAGIKASEAIYIDDRDDRIGGVVGSGMNVIVFKNNINELINDLKKFNLIY
jgi:HAD superfamily hydrolase (TIGR01509 family)